MLRWLVFVERQVGIDHPSVRIRLGCAVSYRPHPPRLPNAKSHHRSCCEDGYTMEPS